MTELIIFENDPIGYSEYVLFVPEDFCALLEILGLNPGSVISCCLWVGKSLNLFLSQHESYLI